MSAAAGWQDYTPKQDGWQDYAPKSGAIPTQKPSGAGGEWKSGEPGFLDKEIPLDSYTNATFSGMQSIGRGLRNAYEGTREAITHPLDTLANIGDVATLGATHLLPGADKARGGETVSSIARFREVPSAIRAINESPDAEERYLKLAGDTAGEAAGQALFALGTEGLARGVPKLARPSVAAAPVRLASRTTEGIVNSSPLRYVRGASRLFTPADEARKMIRVPGRDLGLTKPIYPGAPFPERPPQSLIQARGLATGGQPAVNPSEALARIPVNTSIAKPEAVPKVGKIGGRLVLTPEEAQQAERIQRIAKIRASQRGMQYAGGMKPSGGKIAAP